MLDLIPIVFVLVSLTGIIIMVANRLPELKTEHRQNPVPTWVANLSAQSLATSAWKNSSSFFSRLIHTLSSAKSEFANSRDLAKHLADSLKSKFETNRIRVKAEEEREEERELKDLDEAEELYGQGHYVKAEELVIEVIKDDPAHKPAYELLGKIYLARKNYLEAVEVYRYLTKHSSRNDKYWSSMAEGLVGLEDYSEAIKSYLKSLELYARPEVFVSLGLAYQATGNHNSAVKALESALDLEPENTQVLMLLAENLLYRNEPEAAEEVLEQVLSIEPNNHIARERLMKIRL